MPDEGIFSAALSRPINPTKQQKVRILPSEKHGHDSMLRLLYRNKSQAHITEIKKGEKDNPDWLSQDKRHEVLSPGRGAGKVRRADKIEAGEEKKRKEREESKGLSGQKRAKEGRRNETVLLKKQKWNNEQMKAKPNWEAVKRPRGPACFHHREQEHFCKHLLSKLILELPRTELRFGKTR